MPPQCPPQSTISWSLGKQLRPGGGLQPDPRKTVGMPRCAPPSRPEQGGTGSLGRGSPPSPPIPKVGALGCPASSEPLPPQPGGRAQLCSGTPGGGPWLLGLGGAGPGAAGEGTPHQESQRQGCALAQEPPQRPPLPPGGQLLSPLACPALHGPLPWAARKERNGGESSTDVKKKVKRL